MDSVLLTFHNPTLEAGWRAYEAESLRGVDVLGCSALLLALAPTLLHLSTPAPELVALVAALAAALLWPLVHRPSWHRWRPFVLASIPTSLTWLVCTNAVHAKAPHWATTTELDPAVSAALRSRLLILAGLGPMYQLVSLLLFGLPLRVHLPTHTLVAAMLLARKVRPVCNTLLAAGGSAASDAIVAWAGWLDTAAGWLPQTHALAATQCAAALGPPPNAACLQLLAWVQLLFGLFLGSWLVWLLERRSRRAFLLQLKDNGSDAPPAPIASLVGWSLLPLAALAAAVAWAAAAAALALQSSGPGAMIVTAIAAAAVGVVLRR